MSKFQLNNTLQHDCWRAYASVYFFQWRFEPRRGFKPRHAWLISRLLRVHSAHFVVKIVVYCVVFFNEAILGLSCVCQQCKQDVCWTIVPNVFSHFQVWHKDFILSGAPKHCLNYLGTLIVALISTSQILYSTSAMPSNDLFIFTDSYTHKLNPGIKCPHHLISV